MKNTVCSDWEDPKCQKDKLCEGEGASVADGLSGRVPMYNEYEKWEHKGYGPNPYPKIEQGGKK